jgi:hypothetical protein
MKRVFKVKEGGLNTFYAQVEIWTSSETFLGYVAFNHVDANGLAKEYADWKNG